MVRQDGVWYFLQKYGLLVFQCEVETKLECAWEKWSSWMGSIENVNLSDANNWQIHAPVFHIEICEKTNVSGIVGEIMQWVVIANDDGHIQASPRPLCSSTFLLQSKTAWENRKSTVAKLVIGERIRRSASDVRSEYMWWQLKPSQGIESNWNSLSLPRYVEIKSFCSAEFSGDRKPNIGRRQSAPMECGASKVLVFITACRVSRLVGL